MINRYSSVVNNISTGFIRLLLVIAAVFSTPLASGLASENSLAGNVTYTLNKATNPTADQTDAYAKIKVAMDSALYYYNTYTSITKKLNISYEPSVSTADGNSNGSIRFGSNRSYMVACTAMHEIAHATGVGTTTNYQKLIVNGVFTGVNATNMLKEVTADQTAVLKGDSQHFWPYGLNYSSEVKSTTDLINHVKIVNAMQKDFHPTGIKIKLAEKIKNEFYLSMNSEKMLTYNIPSGGTVELSVYTIAGQRVAVLDKGLKTAGKHTVQVKGLRVTSGLYMYRLNVGGQLKNYSFIN